MEKRHKLYGIKCIDIYDWESKGNLSIAVCTVYTGLVSGSCVSISIYDVKFITISVPIPVLLRARGEVCPDADYRIVNLWEGGEPECGLSAYRIPVLTLVSIPMHGFIIIFGPTTILPSLSRTVDVISNSLRPVQNGCDFVNDINNWFDPLVPIW